MLLDICRSVGESEWHDEPFKDSVASENAVFHSLP